MSGHYTFKNKIKIYSDGADKESMLKMYEDPSIQGLTTNPTLMKKAGVKDYRAFCKDILTTIKDKPISFEVFADNFDEMKRQALEIATWGENVYVKIPVTNSEGMTSVPLIKELSHQGIKLNVTAIMTLEQVKEVVDAVKGGSPAIVSVFAGRIADTGRDPIPLMQEAAKMCEAAGPDVELLWASPREVLNIVQAESCGCHIITATPSITDKMNLFGKSLDQFSLETVQMFKNDSIEAGFQL